MTRKAIFFDIDGTLWGMDNVIPESTKEAIRRLQENGHLVFICTGRTKCFMENEAFLSLGFDGVISGCGTYIEYKNMKVFESRLSQDTIEHALQVLSEAGMTALMEGAENIYAVRSELEQVRYGRYLYETAGHIILETDAYRGNWNGAKFTVVTNGHSTDPVDKALGGEFDLLIHDSHIFEMVPKGFSKASGIRQICELLDIDLKDTVAFGDSANDIDMLDLAGLGIVMGNGEEAAKAHADHVTDDLKKDGIYKACEKFGLI